jgi:hemerythrin superfamily protein
MTQPTTASASAKSKAQSTDALALLKADHDLVEDLFGKFEKARTDEQKDALADQICMELTIHAQIEEEIFYPAVREAIDDEDLIDEAEVEHATAKDLIAQIEDSQAGDDKFEAKVTVLGEYIRHHVKEEESEMFPKVKKTDLDLKELGSEMAARKAELQSE